MLHIDLASQKLRKPRFWSSPHPIASSTVSIATCIANGMGTAARRRARPVPQGSPGTAGSVKPLKQSPHFSELPDSTATVADPEGGVPLDATHSATAADRSPRKLTAGTLVPSLLAGVVCGLILFVFCCVFSSMIFKQDGMPEQLNAAVPLGVGMHTVSVMVGSLVFARFSGCKAVVAGPDINPVVFIAEATASIVESICPGGTCPADMQEKVVPTVLAGCWVATLLIGMCFFVLGACNLTGVVGYMPANVTAGFLSCIGFKVIKYSLAVATGYPLKLFKPGGKYLKYLFGSWDKSWKLLLPGIPIGLLLYFFKRWHISKPSITFPVLIVIPTALFYICIFATGNTLASMRDDKWFYPETDGSVFYEQVRKEPTAC